MITLPLVVRSNGCGPSSLGAGGNVKLKKAYIPQRRNAGV
jgi:hypothetical protein